MFWASSAPRDSRAPRGEAAWGGRPSSDTGLLASDAAQWLLTTEKRSRTRAAAGEPDVSEELHLVCCSLCRTAREGTELTREKGRTDLEVRETGCCRGAGVLAGREGSGTTRLNAFSATQNPAMLHSQNPSLKPTFSLGFNVERQEGHLTPKGGYPRGAREVDPHTAQSGQEGAGPSRWGMRTGHLEPLTVLSHGPPRACAGKHDLALCKGPDAHQRWWAGRFPAWESGRAQSQHRERTEAKEEEPSSGTTRAQASTGTDDGLRLAGVPGATPAAGRREKGSALPQDRSDMQKGRPED